MSKTRRKEEPKSQKSREEFEGKEKHIWHKKLKDLLELKYKELEEEINDEDKTS